MSTIQKSGEPYEVDNLELGDFLITGLEENPKFVIERKSSSDFWASVKDGRLWSQSKDLAKAKDEGYIPLVIIELEQLGNLAYNPNTKKRQYVETLLLKENELAFYNSQLGVIKFGVGIILTSTPEGTARFIVDQSKKLGQPKEKKAYPERGGFKKDWSTDKKKLYLFEAFGYETGKAFLKKWKDMLNGMPSEFWETDWKQEIADAKLTSGRRIGESKAKEIYEVLFS